MSQRPTMIFGLASISPPPLSASAPALAAGHDVEAYKGWPCFQAAEEADHPSTLGARALEKALVDAQIDSSQLGFILFTGISRDYLPSWSVATEIAALTGCNCIAWDMTIGCLGILMGLETASGWLHLDKERRYGAIVTAERWAYTVDRTDVSKDALWAHSDGAAAIIVGNQPGPRRPIAVYDGLTTVSIPEMNGFVRIKYGGTRHPLQEGTNPHERVLRGDAKRELFPKYLSAYKQIISVRKSLASVPPVSGVCNQISPKLVDHIEELLDFKRPDAVPRTGLEHGHVGGCDTVLGLEAILDGADQLEQPIMVLASSPYAFGAASLYPPK